MYVNISSSFYKIETSYSDLRSSKVRRQDKVQYHYSTLPFANSLQKFFFLERCTYALENKIIHKPL